MADMPIPDHLDVESYSGPVTYESIRQVPLGQVSAAAGVLALLGIAASGSASVRFYNELGLAPAEVGLDYASMLMRTGLGFLGVLLLFGVLLFNSVHGLRHFILGCAPTVTLATSGASLRWPTRVLLIQPAIWLFIAWLLFAVSLVGPGNDLWVLAFLAAVSLQAAAFSTVGHAAITAIEGEHSSIFWTSMHAGVGSVGLAMIGVWMMSGDAVAESNGGTGAAVEAANTVMLLLLVGAPLWLPLAVGGLTALAMRSRAGSRLGSRFGASSPHSPRSTMVGMVIVLYLGLAVICHTIATTDAKAVMGGSEVRPNYLNQLVHRGAICTELALMEGGASTSADRGLYLGNDGHFLVAYVTASEGVPSGVVRIPIGQVVTSASRQCTPAP